VPTVAESERVRVSNYGRSHRGGAGVWGVGISGSGKSLVTASNGH